ncbi:CatB-related O-acetyltransferase [Brevibacterium zhoupengii]|uniref:CatB-related O-acetyltransferase n=1 Tax=Brevibacterium zhoupengii TaxID=2898795 RepID=UPI001E4674CF|nr:CatB-related O-acetyltransferase [Brevibacterium zhoupengii]
MTYKAQLTSEILEDLYRHKVFFRYNSPPLQDGRYGWVKEDTEVSLPSPVTLEQNSALYGGPYRGLVGGGSASGFNSIGSFSYTYSALPHEVSIGRYCSISTGLKILDSTHPTDTITSSAITFRPRNKLFSEHMTPQLHEHSKTFPVRPTAFPIIEHDVWIGSNVVLSPRIRIGTGAVIAAGSLVTKDVAPYTIVGGNPAQPIRRRFTDELCTALIDSRWWNYEPTQVFNQDLRAIETLIDRIKDNLIEPYEPWSITLGKNID